MIPRTRKPLINADTSYLEDLGNAIFSIPIQLHDYQIQYRTKLSLLSILPFLTSYLGIMVSKLFSQYICQVFDSCTKVKKISHIHTLILVDIKKERKRWKRKKRRNVFSSVFILFQCNDQSSQKNRNVRRKRKENRKEKVKNWIFFFIPYLTAIISPFRKINVSQRKKENGKKKKGQ